MAMVRAFCLAMYVSARAVSRVRKFVTLMSALYQFEVTDKLKSDVMVMSLRRQNVTLFVIFKISD